ncbi:flagellar biosynthesis regulator FlaF [Enterovirga aerilata]|uniref:Flagellar biosynthesis regulator FlaF n=1 Tax=Enterovirga aerilata TaxID=2730920 RepID=A0A849IBC9_9HYPH|nr:flagellar biosynthesis regulator FlaF [Enterovirga sp. DB1703]NNM74708.1 flagellar biosynthesis regulator FlaF [Enterovirga sp. DB1703]
MQHAAANAYAQAAKYAQPPRELEAALLLKAAYRLQTLADDWSKAGTELAPALTYNGRIWSILATSATEPSNPLPSAIKQNIAQLAVVIFQRIFDISEEPGPEKLGLLIRINRDVAAGLRGQG